MFSPNFKINVLKGTYRPMSLRAAYRMSRKAYAAIWFQHCLALHIIKLGSLPSFYIIQFSDGRDLLVEGSFQVMVFQYAT